MRSADLKSGPSDSVVRCMWMACHARRQIMQIKLDGDAFRRRHKRGPDEFLILRIRDVTTVLAVFHPWPMRAS